ncbi:tRNA isopentenyl-2-thiomethyl-A-37 hydroxylase MiaE [Thermosynechococcus sp. HN-54]|uniref:tRNA-(ms[2]io[6]A)-hydroxylase n=1 Tax=Thermosynechococcus sp. HN-54 TaxID=2933959 RepID=UPI00202CE825|nr:tRNA isopentenyl-2-thiomethyl-A-37 hydroxylase MiaE [Thermosynechococcus sp. HN-54]URR34674.1 tRNA isopentenyl-2-thiomethyl-A-37 hydroxylase MiaE [Thermosynechococcus sp. HN-54]
MPTVLCSPFSVAVIETPVRIKCLVQPTRPEWVMQAIAHLDTILLDHSHCERKAASVAINLMFRYPSHKRLVDALTDIAQEELEHFRQVNQQLERRHIALAPLSAPPYASRLNAAVRPQEPDRFLDTLLVCALIEARSHERLQLLAQHCPDRELAEFFASLVTSEARHYGTYWYLAYEFFGQEAVENRLRKLATLESEILSTPYPLPRIHS